MKQEDKDLLLKDLCARLPYGVRFEYNGQFSQVLYETNGMLLNNHYEIEKCKPFLRPVSSMTNNEIETYRIIIKSLLENSITDNVATLYNFLNSKYLDYNGLIERGLAIEVTEENNPYKE